jgi:hypothetical protein
MDNPCGAALSWLAEEPRVAVDGERERAAGAGDKLSYRSRSGLNRQSWMAMSQVSHLQTLRDYPMPTGRERLETEKARPKSIPPVSISARLTSRKLRIPQGSWNYSWQCRRRCGRSGRKCARSLEDYVRSN